MGFLGLDCAQVPWWKIFFKIKILKKGIQSSLKCFSRCHLGTTQFTGGKIETQSELWGLGWWPGKGGWDGLQGGIGGCRENIRGVLQRSVFALISFNASLINLAQKVRVFKWNLQIVQSWEAPSTQTKIAISRRKNWMTLGTEVIEMGWNWTVQNARSCTKGLIMRISARSCWEWQRKRKTWVS